MTAIYIASSGKRRHKIGISARPDLRVRQLELAGGRRMTLVEAHEVPDPAAVERMAHWLLQADHDVGEWFSVDAATASAAIVEASARVAAGDRAPSTAAGRGPKPLGVKGVYVWLFESQPARIDSVVGKTSSLDLHPGSH